MGFYDASVGDNPNQQSGRAVMALQQAGNEIQQLRQALQEAQSGMQSEMLKAQTQIQIARENNDAKRDIEELKGLVQLLVQQMTPPPMLASEVSQDLQQ